MAILTSLLRTFRLAALLGVSTVVLTACFDPQQPGCAFSCATDQLCPSGYSCGNDSLCHRNDGQGTCSLTAVTGDAGGDTPGDAR